MQWLKTCVISALASLDLVAPALTQDKAKAPDLTKQPTLFVVAYAHLDTEWRWCYPQTIREYIPATLDENFRLFEKYPSYVFNFSGSRRYQMMREYYPEGYAKLKQYVAAGHWFPCGSSVDENDANVPSAESYVRHVLYGNRFFRRELGIASDEYMLPDCFGFPAALPSLLAHCGIQGFSTQKLTWNAAVPIPFKVGVWQGPDGHSVIAALDPGSYGSEVLENLATSEGWQKRIEANAKISGVQADYHYYGTGDRGGSPTERSVEMVEKSLSSDGPLRIVAGPADALVHAITPAMREKLPRYTGELQLTEHSAGSITSEAFMKRMNRKNEHLADAAERASVGAWWLGAREYPAQKLEDAWTLVLGSQMHDILPGTSHPRAYDFAWNDELIAANEFGAVLTDAAGVMAGSLDTRGSGVALVVFNPLSVEREDVVEAEIPGDAKSAKGVSVAGPDGKPVPAQILDGSTSSVRVAFLTKAPPVGFAVFDVRLEGSAKPMESALSVDERRLENERYVVKLDEHGDVSSILDKAAKREMLAAPARLELHYENPKNWPAWNQDWADRQLPVKEVVGDSGAPPILRVVERGPARVAVEVVREVGASTFIQRIRLSAGGAGDRVEFDTQIDWAARERSLRASFPLSVKNPKATYDLQVGALERGNGHEKQFEYAAQQWCDLTDVKGDYGVALLNDCKYGSDKPNDNTLRLTLLHTPGTRGGYQDQGTQDIGRQRVLYAVSGHTGDWRQGKSAVQAARLNQPLAAFRATAHDGALKKSISLFKVSDDSVRITALKKAEDSDEVIVRLRELSGSAKRNVHITAAWPIVAAREVDGQERAIFSVLADTSERVEIVVSAGSVRDGEFSIDIGGFELRAFAIKLGEPPAKSAKSQSTALDLAFDTDVASTNGKRGDGAMDAEGQTFPAEQLPATIVAEDVTFKLGPTADGQKNAVTCRGQELKLPASGDSDRIYLLAASSSGDVQADVQIDGQPLGIRVRDWTGFVGQWDRRLWLGDVPELTFGWSNELGGLEPGYVKPETIAWCASHHHTPGGDTYYAYCYLYKIAIDLPKGAKSIRLPKDERIKVLAATAVKSGSAIVVPAAPLSDTLADHAQDAPRIVPGAGAFNDAVDVRIDPKLYWRAGSIRYTLDGSEPTTSSNVYGRPFALNGSGTIKAAVLDGGGHLGPATLAKIEVNDMTPPTVKAVTPMYASPLVRVAFSEPVDEAATLAQSYAIDPKLEVRAVKKGEGDREVVLELAAAPVVDKTYHLRISGVKDNSPAHNAMKPAAIEMTVKGPVFQLAEIGKDKMGTEIRDVPGLPVKAGDAWTLNMFVRADKAPANRTLFAGFGQCEQASDGVARYMAKFASGLQFWSHNRDVEGRTPFDAGRWQMLTATYDGRVLRFYKDGKKVGEREVQLAADENVVCIAPLDPWEKKRRFEGEIRDLTIWSAALGDEAVRSLQDAGSR